MKKALPGNTRWQQVVTLGENFLSHSSLRTWWDQALKPQHKDTYDVFEGVPCHLVLGNKHSRTWWEFTLLPSFTIPVKSELVHGQQCSFVCYNVFFLLLFCVPNVKKQLFMLQSKFQFFSEIIFYGLRTFLLIYAHIKMLTLNFDSQFLRSITVVNYHQILKERIVSKSELSWLSKNVQNFDLRHLRSWEIAYF